MERPTQWSILETKLIPPKAAGSTVAREKIVSKATFGAQAKLVLLEAPAGYGKTSALAQVHGTLSAMKRRVAWISLDPADNDHASFLCHIVESVRQSGLRFGGNAATLLRSGAPLPASVLRTCLLNELMTLDEELYLFLDVYHCIDDQDVRATMAHLLTAPLERLHMLVATRNRNELPTGRMRTMGQLTEIGASEMAFSATETAEFLGKSCALPLAPEQISELFHRTEGWAASLQLASLALAGTGDAAAFLKAFAGDFRSIEEFLVEEVLERQSSEVQRFLMETSILARFNVGLAQAVTGHDECRRLIDQVLSRNLFLFSLDDRGVWYRYHHLFTDLLKRRFIDRHPLALQDCHRRAAAWLSENGFLPEAIEHAFLARDKEHAGQLLEASAGSLFANGQVSTLQGFAARLPLSIRTTLPRLQLELSWDQEIEWRFTAARNTLDRVGRSLRSLVEKSEHPTTDYQFLSSKLAHREMMLSLLEDKLPQALIRCTQWLENLPSDDPFMRASLGTTVMVVNREHYRCEGVPTDAAAQRALFLEGGAIYGTVFHDAATGMTLFARGDLSQAVQALERSRQSAISLHGESSRLAAMPCAMLAELHYERGELARARALLSQCEHHSAEFGWLDQLIARCITAARLAFLEQRFTDSDALLEAGTAVARKRDMPRLQAHVVNEQVRQTLMAGDIRRAECLLERAPLPDGMPCPTVDRELSVVHELTALSRARLSIYSGAPEVPIGALRKWASFTRERGCFRSFVRVSSTLCHALMKCGDINAARRVALDAVKLPPEAGFVRSLVDEGPGVTAVLEGLLGDTSDPNDEVRHRLSQILIGQQIRSASATWLSSAGHRPHEPLCARELEVLRHAAQGMGTAHTAKSMNLAESTVKWYWSRVFAKLNINRRFDAIRIARQAGYAVDASSAPPSR